MKPKSISLKQGDQYRLHLPGHSTSGYEWQTKNSDDKIVSVKKELEILSTPNPLPGKSPDEVLIIKGLSKGMVKLTVVLRRSWENKAKEIKIYKVTVR